MRPSRPPYTPAQRDRPRYYVAGPMRGRPRFNFDAFDAEAKRLRALGYEVISPAEMDRELGMDENEYPRLPAWFSIKDALRRDFAAIVTCDAIVLLPGWEESEGTQAEIDVARKCGLQILHAGTLEPVRLEGAGLYAARQPVGGHAPPAGEVRVVEQSTGGAKGQKQARFDLIPGDVLWLDALLYGKGAEKYESRNWENGYSWSLSFAALMRHAWQFKNGEDVDPETGLPHMIAVRFHAAALVRFSRTCPELDDLAREA